MLSSKTHLLGNVLNNMLKILLVNMLKSVQETCAKIRAKELMFRNIYRKQMLRNIMINSDEYNLY